MAQWCALQDKIVFILHENSLVISVLSLLARSMTVNYLKIVYLIKSVASP